MLTPIVLTPNQPQRFYRGGAGIARFYGTVPTHDYTPEDFIGSTTEVATGGGVGLSRLDDGTTLASLVEADPTGYLGPRHVAAFGADTGLLVKLLDTGERLLVHFHPDREFARRHLNCPHGKTEAWYITEVATPVGDGATDDSLGCVYLGFTEGVSTQTVDRWMSEQCADDMLAALNKIAVEPGDTFLVPAGTPHAIGAGITLVELQEPVDFSILLEWAGFDIDGPTQGHLGVGFDVALTGLDRSAWPLSRLATLREQRADSQVAPGVTALFPATADEFFRAERLSIRDGSESIFTSEFSILVTLDGAGRLEAAGQSLPLRRGTTVLVPYAAGDVRITGPVDAVRCLPPNPAAPGQR